MRKREGGQFNQKITVKLSTAEKAKPSQQRRHPLLFPLSKPIRWWLRESFRPGTCRWWNTSSVNRDQCLELLRAQLPMLGQPSIFQLTSISKTDSKFKRRGKTYRLNPRPPEQCKTSLRRFGLVIPDRLFPNRACFRFTKRENNAKDSFENQV